MLTCNMVHWYVIFFVSYLNNVDLPNPRSQSEIEDVLCLTFPMAMLKVFLWSSVHKAAVFCHERSTVKVTFVVLTLGESESLCAAAVQ